MRRRTTTVKLDKLDTTLNGLSKDEGWQTYHCTLVTPMYGGGVEAGKVDENMPIRASSIRGQLRFWWRIACGPDDPKELFKQEKDIWGGIGTKETPHSNDNGVKQTSESKDDDKAKKTLASRVQVRVKCPPLQKQACYVDTGYSFELLIRCIDCGDCDLELDDIQKQVTETLRWWSTFGGLGGKTRRGYGALEIGGVDSLDEDIKNNKNKVRCSIYEKKCNSPEKARRQAEKRLDEYLKNIPRSEKKTLRKAFVFHSFKLNDNEWCSAALLLPDSDPELSEKKQKNTVVPQTSHAKDDNLSQLNHKSTNHPFSLFLNFFKGGNL